MTTSELVAPPARGRVFTLPARAGLADCAPSGRVRLDALARWLQDIAYADVEDAGVERHAVWVVRRTRLNIERFPRFGERFTLSTFCSGFGRMWAERRTTIGRPDSAGADVEAVSLWVHLDPTSLRPSPLTDKEITVYGEAAGDRRVSARLRHRAPDESVRSSPWRFRATDCDLAAHVNNAVYWEPLEEQLLRGEDPARMDVEIEYRSPAQPGKKQVLLDRNRMWILDQSGEQHASVLVAARS